jgi:hypothetical protein
MRSPPVISIFPFTSPTFAGLKEEDGRNHGQANERAETRAILASGQSERERTSPALSPAFALVRNRANSPAVVFFERGVHAICRSASK